MLLTSVVMARLLTKGELATYRQTLLAYNIAAPILSLGLSSGLYFFLPKETKRVKGIVIEGILMMLFMGLLYALFIACGGNHLLAKRFSNPDIEKILLYLIPLPLVMLPSGLLSAVLIVRGKIMQLNIYNIASNLLLGTGVIAACAIWTDPRILVMTYVGISLVTGLVAIIMMLRAVPDGDWLPELGHMKKMLGYSLPLALAGMMGTLALQLDKFIVSAMRTPEEFAVYSNGAIEIPLISIITGAITTVILTEMSAHCKLGEMQEALDLFKKGAVKSAMILLPAMAFLMVYANEFITILFSDKYLGSVGVFRIYLCVLPVRIVVYGAALMALDMTRVVLWRSLGDLLVNALLSCFFVYLWGPYGAAFATVTTLLVWTVPFNLKMIARGFSCRWIDVLPVESVARIALVSSLSALLSGGLTYILGVQNKFFNFSLGALVFGTFFIGIAWRMFPESQEIIQAFVAKMKRVVRPAFN